MVGRGMKLVTGWLDVSSVARRPCACAHYEHSRYISQVVLFHQSEVSFRFSAQSVKRKLRSGCYDDKTKRCFCLPLQISVLGGYLSMY